MEDFLKMMVPDDGECSSHTISTLVFIDLEATGLPSLVGKNNVHITEISLVAVDRTDFETDNSLRVLNKLSLCIRPRTAISPVAMSITGLYNDVLDNQEKFDESIPKLLEYFFRRLRRPLCLLAHNGKKYDFPLLQAELKRINYALDPEILCADTLEAFRSIVSNQNKIHDDSILTSNAENEKTKEVHGDISDQTNINILTDVIIDEEVDKLLSENIEVFKDIKEPYESNIRTKFESKLNTAIPYMDIKANVTQNCSSIGKVSPFLDERTPPKTKNSDDLQNPKPFKKTKLCPTVLNKDASISFQQTQAKRQLFTNGTLNNRNNSKPNISHSKPVQFSLEKLYCHYFGENPPKSHYAEADCIALSKVCQKIHKDFLKWIDKNCTSFSETKAMW